MCIFMCISCTLIRSLKWWGGILAPTETPRNFIIKVLLCSDLVKGVFDSEGDEELPILFSSTLETNWLALLKQIMSLLYYDTHDGLLYYLN